MLAIIVQVNIFIVVIFSVFVKCCHRKWCSVFVCVAKRQWLAELPALIKVFNTATSRACLKVPKVTQL